MKLLQTLALVLGWAYFLVIGSITYVLTMTADTARSIVKVWK